MKKPVMKCIAIAVLAAMTAACPPMKAPLSVTASAEGIMVQKADHACQTTGDFLEALGTPMPGSVGGEWMVIGLTRSGREVPEGYYENATAYVQKNIDEAGRLHHAKSTENSRMILALTAIGADVTDIGGHNLLAPLNDLDYLAKHWIPATMKSRRAATSPANFWFR